MILNPRSKRRNAEKRWPVGLAEEAARAGCSPIIVDGGDGSVGDAAGGIPHTTIPLEDLIGAPLAQRQTAEDAATTETPPTLIDVIIPDITARPRIAW